MDAPRFLSWRTTGRRFLVVACGILLAGSGVSLFIGQSHARSALIDRFDLRADLSSQFLTGYVHDLLEDEMGVATEFLAGAEISQNQLEKVSSVMGFQASVLLDSDGLLIRSFPSRPGMVGQNMTMYDHLRGTLAGVPTVANVVPAAVRGDPVTAFATPFDTPFGRRVFSGDMTLASTSLSGFLGEMSPIANSEAHINDAFGATISDTAAVSRQGPGMKLTSALTTGTSGRYGGEYGPARFVSVPISGTPWRLVLAVPEADLFRPLSGTQFWTPWVLLGLTAVSVIGVLVLMGRLGAAKSLQLRETERLSVTDSMTGLVNRRGFELVGAQMIKTAARASQQLGVIFLDLDGLKTINDRFGHARGDEAIIAFADILSSVVRDSDVTGRLGGDEFAVVTWAIDGLNLSPITARIEERIRSHNLTAPPGLKLSFSSGVSWTDPRTPADLAALLAIADAEMYCDKVAKASLATLESQPFVTV